MSHTLRYLKISSLLILIVAITLNLFIRCNDNEISKTPIPFVFPDVPDFPTQLNIPSDNPTTYEGVALGRRLFYDGRLSGRLNKDSLMSCGSCHLQSRGFECGTDHPRFHGHPRGLPSNSHPEGLATHNVMLPLVNVVYNNVGYTWNGFIEKSNTLTSIPGLNLSDSPEISLANLEAITYMAIVAKDEMNGSLTSTRDAIASDDKYPEMFRAAFGSSDVTMDRVSKAISQFVRSIVSYRSKYHRWLRNEVTFTAEELRGYELFFSEEADCFHCHGGALMTSFGYFNNAKDAEFNDSRDRYSITKKRQDVGAYRAPSLINVEFNGPYMHDGRFETLDEVIDFYSEGLVNSSYVHPLMKFVSQGGVHLTETEKADLKAFLLTLTDHELIADPAYAPPSDLGDWASY